MGVCWNTWKMQDHSRTYIVIMIYIDGKYYLLQLGTDVIKTEVRSQSRSPLMPRESAERTSQWASAAAVTARLTAAPYSNNTVTITTSSTNTTVAAIWWLLPTAAACWKFLMDLEMVKGYKMLSENWQTNRAVYWQESDHMWCIKIQWLEFLIKYVNKY